MKLVLVLFLIFEVFGFGSLKDSKRLRNQNNQTQFTKECSIGIAACAAKGSKVQVDVKNQCMCVGTNCFRIGIGFGGPQMTWNGTSILNPISNNPPRRWGRYRTHINKATTSFDSDGIKIGPPGNFRVGKWIHKTTRCERPSLYPDKSGDETAGCIAVPCEHWPLVKSQLNQQITVCGGRGPQDRVNIERTPPRLKSQIDLAINTARLQMDHSGDGKIGFLQCKTPSCINCVMASTNKRACRQYYSLAQYAPRTRKNNSSARGVQ